MFQVLLPYEFTLLSNDDTKQKLMLTVLLPYEFTLLSNYGYAYANEDLVLLPYEFTLLSNRNIALNSSATFYYLMNLHYSQTETQRL